MRRAVPLLFLLAAACSADVEAVNPYDPRAPVLAPGAVVGSAALADGTPAAGAIALLEGPGLLSTAGADGAFRFDGLAPTSPGVTYSVSVSAELGGLSYGPVRREGVVVPIGQTVELGRLTLPLATGSVSGQVLAGGAPVSGALVSIEGDAVVAITLADGRFALPGAPVGQRRILAAADGFRFAGEEVEIPASGSVEVTLQGSPFLATVALLPGEGSAPGTARQRAILIDASAEGAAAVRAGEDPAFRDPALGDVASRPLVAPLPVELPAGDDGPRTLHLQLQDAEGQRTATAALPVFLDRAAPAAPSGALPEVTADPELELPLGLADPEPSSGPGGFEVAVDGAPAIRLAAGEPLQTGALPEGLRLLELTALDRAGNRGPARTAGLLLDRTAPAVVGEAVLEDDLPGAADPGFVRSREARLVVTLEDDGRLALQELHCVESGPCGYGFEITVSSGGGNPGDRSVLVPDPAGTIRIPVRLEATDGASGEVVLSVADPAGNRLPLTLPYTLDETAPRIRELTVAGGARYTAATAVPLAISADADTSGFRHQVLAAGPCLPAGLAALPFQPLAAASVELGPEEGARVVCVQVRDAAGNLSEVASATVIADRTAPAPLPAATLRGLLAVDLPTAVDGLLFEKGQAARVAGVTAEPIVAVWAAATDASPLEVLLEAVDSGAGPSFAGIPAAPLGSGVPQRAVLVLPPGDGDKELHARLRDAAGNVTDLPLSGTLEVALDRLPPDAPWIQPVAGVIDAPPSAAVPGYAEVTLSFSGLDDDQGEILELYAARAAPPGGGPVVNAEFAWTDVQALLDPACPGAYRCLQLVVRQNRTTRLFLRTRDLAGNLSAESAVEIVEDSSGPAAPAGLSLTAGNARALATWAPPAIAANGSQDTEVAGYEVWYGSDSGGTAGPLELAGVVAAEGPSPLVTVASQLQLTGIQNGAAIAFAVRAYDLYAATHPDARGRFCPAAPAAPGGFDPGAAHCSPFTPVARGWPGEVTPVVLGTAAVAGELSDVATAAGYAWAIGETAGVVQLRTFDLANPTAPAQVGGALNLPGQARGIRRHGTLACVAHGTGGASLISLANPRAPALLATVLTLDDARGCDLSRGRLAVAFHGLDGPGLPSRCDPARRAGVVIYDVSIPAAPLELSRYGASTHQLLGTPADVQLLGEDLYTSVEVGDAPDCPYTDGDVVRVDLATAAVDYGDIGEGGLTMLASTDGARLAGLRGGRIAIYELGGLPFVDPLRTLTGAPLPVTVPLDGATHATFLGPRLYVADPAAVSTIGGPPGAIQILDPRDGQLVGRVDVPGATGIAGEGAMAVVVGSGGLTVLQLASPTGLRISGSLPDVSNLKHAVAGPYALVGVGGSLATLDLSDGLTRYTDYSDPGNPDLQGDLPTGCAAFAVGMTRDRVILGCHGGAVLTLAREGRSYVSLGSIFVPGPSDAPAQIVVDGDRVYMASSGSGNEVRLHVLELTSAGLVHRGSVRLAARAQELVPLAVQGNLVAVGLEELGLALVDVANPAAPVLVPTPSPLPNAGGVAFAGSLLYASTFDPATNLVALDATDPRVPVRLGQASPVIPRGGLSPLGTLAWSAGMLFATLYYEDGALFDATGDPASPVLVGGVVNQLRNATRDATFSDTCIVLGAAESTVRLELE